MAGTESARESTVDRQFAELLDASRHARAASPDPRSRWPVGQPSGASHRPECPASGSLPARAAWPSGTAPCRPTRSTLSGLSALPGTRKSRPKRDRRRTEPQPARPRNPVPCENPRAASQSSRGRPCPDQSSPNHRVAFNASITAVMTPALASRPTFNATPSISSSTVAAVARRRRRARGTRAGDGAAPSSITAGTNAAASGAADGKANPSSSNRFRKSRRHAYSCDGSSPCRRATALTPSRPKCRNGTRR